MDFSRFFKVLVTFLLLISIIFASTTYKGQVINKDNGKALLGVNIFFNNTSIGTTSDENGYFQISISENIHANLILQHIGYELVEMDLAGRKGKFLLIELTPSAIQFEPVIITSKLSLRQRYDRTLELKKFFDKFFLNKEISDKYCEILNTEYLHFDYKKPEFKVFCDTLLVLKNEYLGYNEKIAIKDFQWTQVNNHFYLRWSYFTNYEELSTTDHRQKLAWQANREYIYRGTVRHFIKSLIENNSVKEGFKIYDCKLVPKGFSYNDTDVDTRFSINNTHDLRKTDYNSLFFSDVFKISEKENHCVVEFLKDSDYLIIEYKNRIKAYIYFGTHKVFCGYFGNFMNQGDILIGGDWQNYGAESLLPIDYEPGD